MRFPFLTSNYDLLIVNSDLKTELIPGPFLGWDTYFNNLDSHDHNNNFQAIVRYTPDENAIVTGIAKETEKGLDLNARLETQFRIRKVVITDNYPRFVGGLILTCENELHFFSFNPLDENSKTVYLLEKNIFDVVGLLEFALEIVVLTIDGYAFKLELSLAEEHRLVSLFSDPAPKIQQITGTRCSASLLTSNGETYVFGYVLHSMYDFISEHYTEQQIDKSINDGKPLLIPNLSPARQVVLMFKNMIALGLDDQLQIRGDNTSRDEAVVFPKLVSNIASVYATNNVCFCINTAGEYEVYYDGRLASGNPVACFWASEMKEILTQYKVLLPSRILNFGRRTKSARNTCDHEGDK